MKKWNGAAAVVIEDGRLLMVRGKGSSAWSIPSGGIEDNETSESACIREVWEETGYHVKVERQLFVKKATIKSYQVTTQYYYCTYIGGAMQYHDPDETIEEIDWKSIEQLREIELLYPEDVEMLEELLVDNLYTHISQNIIDNYKNHTANRPFIVAIDGLSGAGKTTFANEIKNRLAHTLVIHIDDHIVERKERYNTGFEQWYEYYQLQWDTVYLAEQLYQKVHQNAAQLQLPFYDKDRDRSVMKTIDLSPEHIIIIEGIFLLREEWKHYYDCIFFLDCPTETRYERVLQRDTYIGDAAERLKKYQERYWVAEEYYLKKQAPLEMADSIFKC